MSAKVTNITDTSAYIFGDAGLVTDSENRVVSFQIVDKYNTFKNGGFLRISGPYLNDNSIITINEPIDVSNTIYKIVNDLTNCTATGAVNIAANTTASIVITADVNYSLPDTITVSGASYTWDKSSGTITLSNPTDTVTVIVVAVGDKPKYTNMIPLSINADGSQYIGTNGEDGYKTGYRLNSSGEEKTASGIEVTGYIPCTKTDVLRFANMTFAKSGTGKDNTYIATYDSDKKNLTSSKLSTLSSSVT